MSRDRSRAIPLSSDKHPRRGWVSARDLYAQLRVDGEMIIQSYDLGLITTMRQLAKADGLILRQSRIGDHTRASGNTRAEAAGNTRAQNRVTLSHPDRPTDLYRPDEKKET